ncbi:MAG: 4Fe-4S dicluster domain-containing protein [Clostridiales Family XIII bacterium]|jgi:formate hydrogenlyase subunit 6/NADH:ubiquinone oxidoreductase subunit I|nr:4Fe-4S dicluster domain-containing protein [Clostridiales Family XIII bacterium]
MMYLLKENFDKAREALAGAYAVVVPDEVLPPKDALFPRSETLYETDRRTGEARAAGAGGKTLLFGVRPCDARAIGNLDAAFLESGYVDANYAQRRENATIVALACAQIPSPACFCDSMGGSPHEAPEADVVLTEAADGSGYALDFQSEKGSAVAEIWKAADLIGPMPAHLEKAPAPTCTLKVNKVPDLAQKLTAAFEDGLWERLAEACLGCGCCTYVCPTCYCFDIGLENRGGTADTFRCWDSCMFPGYTQMAGGHNPRWSKTQRLRNRYLHKLAYFDERYGRTLCVGCGRCICRCPQGLDITRAVEWGERL